MTDLRADRATLATIEGFPNRDSRRLEFTVLLSDGTPKDISEDTPEWYLLGKPYHDDSEAIIDDSDPGVEIVTDTRIDTAAGEFEVRIDPETLVGEWGPVTQRVRLSAGGGTTISWRGRIVLTVKRRNGLTTAGRTVVYA